ncbi:siroheme synthase [Hydrogenophilus thermoluteolus]|uniref:SirB2 family protein n=1 Tax=Hydrogenophilus thermoluteolus TaxID=297 RepID=UPI00249FD6A1|nr:SirB2 family protein [Hydrogenophilus thermoluteolus]GLW61300.1 siroheme synthase [Hydrogenophilus thermoluteolus]
MSYLLLKHLHLTTVALTITGFLLRFTWRLRSHPWLHAPLTRVLPHINDTLLLTSGLGMAAMIGQYPFTTPWLTAKFFWLLAYIIAGHFALKRAQTRRGQWCACVVALVCVAMLVGTAIYHHPLSWLTPRFAIN